MKQRIETKKIIIHCSDTLGGSAAAIKRYHMAAPPLGRGWEDIAYHFVIDYTGLVEIGRNEYLIGGHCQGENHDSIGICLIGVSEFRSAQFESLKKLVRGLLDKYGLTADDVTAHSEWPSAKKQSKTCPNLSGEFLRNFIKGVTA